MCLLEEDSSLLFFKPMKLNILKLMGGGQYIDTGYVPKKGTRVLMLFDATGSGTGISGLMGARKDANSEAYTIWLFEGNKIGGQYENNAYNSNPIELDYNQRILYDFDDDTLWAGTSSASYSQDSSPYPEPGCNLTLFAVNTNGSVDARRAKGKLYKCQIYDNETLVRDYIPMVYKGKACLYDKVNDTYTYSSSGKFIAGPKVEEKIAWSNIIKEQAGDITFYQEVLSLLGPGETINIFIDFTNTKTSNISNKIFGFTFRKSYSTSTAYTLGSNALPSYIPNLFQYSIIAIIPIYTSYASLNKNNIHGHHKAIISLTRGKTAEENAALNFYCDGIQGTITDEAITDDTFESGMKIFNANESLSAIGFSGTYHDISILKGKLTDLQMALATFN